MQSFTTKKYIFSLLSFLLILISSNTIAGEISIKHPISFGHIDVHPGGDAIIISAQNGSALPESTRSIVTGGESGQLQITSESLEHVEFIYPASVTMESGQHSITITEIDVHSQYSSGGADVLGSGFPLDVHIGGKMQLSGTEENGSYGGVMSITINFEANSISLQNFSNAEQSTAPAEESSLPLTEPAASSPDTPEENSTPLNSPKL